MSLAQLHAMFDPSGSLIEMMIRGTIVYLTLFLLLRVVLKRRAHGLSMPDVLLIVLIADASKNSMSGDHKSITEGLVLVGTILFWNYALDWMTFRSSSLQKLIVPAPLLLVRQGEVQHESLRAELITMMELKTMLRERGFERIKDVDRAYLEPDGTLTAFGRKPHTQE
jgi:uncharacterized membrane protein YcaP (DUF421 family)